MTIYYSKTTRGFYDDSVHTKWPDDSVEVWQSVHRQLFEEQARGKQIVPDAEGRPIAVLPIASDEDVLASLRASVQRYLDAQAKDAGYDNIAAAISYADEPAVARFQQEGQAFRAWRSLAWLAAYKFLDALNAAGKPLPAAAELIAELPALDLS